MVEVSKRARRADDCGPHGHGQVRALDPRALERAAALFRAAGDVSRLRLLHALDGEERCVSDLASLTDTRLSTLSQQLRVLHLQNIVTRRRDGKHIYYGLADEHVRELVRAALEHASEASPAAVTPTPRRTR